MPLASSAVAVAGCSGGRNFEDFKRLVIDRARTRVFAFVNIVGHGMRGARYENDLNDMQATPTAEVAMRHKGLIAWKEWPVKAWLGTPAAKSRVVEFLRASRPLYDWLDRHVGPGTPG